MIARMDEIEREGVPLKLFSGHNLPILWSETPEDAFAYRPELQPLFAAMKSGAVVRSVVCMRGDINANNPEKDFAVQNLIATGYRLAASAEDGDSVAAEVAGMPGTQHFYMSWVRTFEV